MDKSIYSFIHSYKFRPAPTNPYLSVPEEEDEDIEMDQMYVDNNLRFEILFCFVYLTFSPLRQVDKPNNLSAGRPP